MYTAARKAQKNFDNNGPSAYTLIVRRPGGAGNASWDSTVKDGYKIKGEKVRKKRTIVIVEQNVYGKFDRGFWRAALDTGRSPHPYARL
jgi:hypothetical protein